MTPREAEKLLGGYATGTLTEAERSALFTAALEDQDVFNALADEEALRALLADPAVRAHLLKTLAAPAAKAAIPFWRRPGSMGLAASLLLAVGVSWMLRHGPQPEAPPLPHETPLEETPKVAKPGGKVEGALESKSPELAQPAQRKRTLFAAPPPPAPTPPPAPAPAVADAASSSGYLYAQENRAAPAPARDKAEAKRIAPPASAPLGRLAGGASIESSLAKTASKNMASPQWAFESAPTGTFRLKVLWGPEGHLYLVCRTTSGVSVLTPISASTKKGKTESVFTGPSSPESVLDLYLLPEPTAAPQSLPAEGSISGFRRRILPLEEKTP